MKLPLTNLRGVRKENEVDSKKEIDFLFYCLDIVPDSAIQQI